jgi:hypothetical protein
LFFYVFKFSVYFIVSIFQMCYFLVMVINHFFSTIFTFYTFSYFHWQSWIRKKSLFRTLYCPNISWSMCILKKTYEWNMVVTSQQWMMMNGPNFWYFLGQLLFVFRIWSFKIFSWSPICTLTDSRIPDYSCLFYFCIHNTYVAKTNLSADLLIIYY